MWPMPPRQPVYGWEELLAWAVAGAVLVSVTSDLPAQGSST